MPNVAARDGVAYVRNPSVLAANLGPDQVALLGASRDNYHGLEGPASRIWELLETPHTLETLCRQLVAEFEVEPDDCARDTREFLDALLAEELAIEQGEPLPS